MTKHRVAELDGALLDAAVALAEGYTNAGAVGATHPTPDKPWCLSGCNDWWMSPNGKYICAGCHGFPKAASTDWGVGGPIIERERIAVIENGYECTEWDAYVRGFYSTDEGLDGDGFARGPTPLIAAMRAYVTSKLGEEVELP